MRTLLILAGVVQMFIGILTLLGQILSSRPPTPREGVSMEAIPYSVIALATLFLIAGLWALHVYRKGRGYGLLYTLNGIQLLGFAPYAIVSFLQGGVFYGACGTVFALIPLCGILGGIGQRRHLKDRGMAVPPPIPQHE